MGFRVPLFQLGIRKLSIARPFPFNTNAQFLEVDMPGPRAPLRTAIHALLYTNHLEILLKPDFIQ